MRSRSLLVASAGFALALLLGACGGSKSSSSPSTTPSTGHVAIAASANPSASAQMICEKEAVDSITSVFGVKTTKVTTPTWKDHVYSCSYVYPGGARMTLSVKELSDANETTAYFNSLKKTLGDKGDLQGLAQGAFTTSAGNVVVRKDYKVLIVDTSRLPAEFGDPPDTPEHMAVNAAATIMTCWTGE